MKFEYDHEHWRKTIRFLRQTYKTSIPVSIRRVKRQKDAGATFFDGYTLTIKIRTEQSWEGQIDSLLHEYAHVCAIDEACRHEGRWGEFFGKIYQGWENCVNID